MANVGSLFVDLMAGTATWELDLGRASRALTSTQARMNRALKTLDRAFDTTSAKVVAFARSHVNLRTAIATVLGTGGIGLLVKTSLEHADAVAKQANAIGISAGALQEFGHAANLAGVSQEQLTSSLGIFVKRLGEMRAGTGEMATGLRAADAQLLANLRSATSVEEAFGAVMRAIDGAAGAADRARIANAAFGRSGIGMVNLVKDGAAGFEAARREARDLGLVIGDDLLRAAEAANDQLSRLWSVLKTKAVVAVVEMAPRISDLSQRILDSLPALIKWVDQWARFFGLIGQSSTERLAATDAAIAEVEDRMHRGIPGFPGEEKRMREQSAVLLERLRGERDRLAREIAGREAAFSLRPTAGSPIPMGAAPDIETGFSAAQLSKAREMALVDRDRLRAFEEQEKFYRFLDRTVGAIADKNRELETAARAVWDSTRTPMEAYVERVQEIDALFRAGKISAETAGRAGDQAFDALTKTTERASEGMRAFRFAAEDAGFVASRALEDVTVGATRAGEAVRNLAQDLARIVFRETAGRYASSLVSTGLSALGARLFPGPSSYEPGAVLAAPLEPPRFAHGGSFAVPGVGPTDSRPVSFMASPGETVTVAPAGAGGAGRMVNVYQSFDLRGADMSAIMQLRREAERIKAETLAGVRAALDDGGDFARAAGRR